MDELIQWIRDNKEWLFSGIAIFVFAGLIGLVRFFIARRRIDPNKVAQFIREGQDLRARLNEEPLPIQEHNDWVDRMVSYFKQYKGHAYVVRLSDFSGMTFLGDGSARSKMSMLIDGRIRRLNEFISELGPK